MAQNERQKTRNEAFLPPKEEKTTKRKAGEGSVILSLGNFQLPPMLGFPIHIGAM